jgi:alpha-D-xyloside xylohydrolase
MPYIYSVAWKVTNEGYSFLRGLPMSYSRDTYTYNITDQFFFGPSIMVRPVTRPFSYEPGFGGIDITPEHFLSPNGKEHGSEISIYRGLMFDKLVLNRKIDVGQIAWFGCIPSELDSVYSVSILGQLKADTSGIHTIYIKTNGGIRLWMGDSLLVNNPENHDERTFQTTIMLTSYQSCPFRIEHRQFIPQTANFKLNWKKPGTPSITDTKINLYLPNHELWYDFWTGASILGGQTIKVTPPLNQIPLYIPAGSIIPVGPEIQYATERSSEPIELRVYPGKDGEFVLYDDEGDTYNYERGYSAQIPILWNDSKKTLTIGTQIGSYPRAPKQQIFHIVLVKSGHGSGIENTSNPDKIIHYKQRAVTIKL